MFLNLHSPDTTNFFLTQTSIWGLCFFFITIYTLLWTTVIFYTIPNVSLFVSTDSSIKATYNYTPGLTNLILIITPLLILLNLLLSWTSPTILAWYGHVLFANWQYRISYLVIINFFALLVAYSTSIYFSSNDVYDYYLVIFNFFFELCIFFTRITCSHLFFSLK